MCVTADTDLLDLVKVLVFDLCHGERVPALLRRALRNHAPALCALVLLQQHRMPGLRPR
jgi:hypothetical protein